MSLERAGGRPIPEPATVVESASSLPARALTIARHGLARALAATVDALAPPSPAPARPTMPMDLWTLTPDDLHVLQTIAAETNPDTGWCELGVTRLAEVAHMSRGYVVAALDLLQWAAPADAWQSARPPLVELRPGPHGRRDVRLLPPLTPGGAAPYAVAPHR